LLLQTGLFFENECPKMATIFSHYKVLFHNMLFYDY